MLVTLAFESVRSWLEVKKQNVRQVTRKLPAEFVPVVFP